MDSREDRRHVLSNVTWAGLLMGVFTHAHLVIVFFRSHGDPATCKTYPLRFVLRPAGM